MPRKKQLDPSILEAALEGLQTRLAEVDRNIAEVRQRIGGGGAPAAGPRRRRTLSAAARKRISEAQKRRWAKRASAGE